MREVALLIHILLGASAVVASASGLVDNRFVSWLDNKFGLLAASTLLSGVGLLFAGAGIGRTCVSAGVFLVAITALRVFSAKSKTIKVINKD